ncbi:unnamed protein product [Cuscuta campestris]|uniref:Uncharacterized protein n=1 Tax=Cuscuta campestris TaxID=132261 RepID=A0A484L193_9ASTE|nr:unnamed protein product [Cuscuta campestris]
MAEEDYEEEVLNVTLPAAFEMHLPSGSPVPDCTYCGAKRMVYKPLGFCCSQGEVVLASNEMPSLLKDIFIGNDLKAKHFQSANTFAFTSIGLPMDDHQLIPEITPQSRTWTCKGNKVKGMTYNEDILVIDERLQLHETYLISNAKVSPITNSFGFPDDNYKYLWTINRWTMIQDSDSDQKIIVQTALPMDIDPFSTFYNAMQNKKKISPRSIGSTMHHISAQVVPNELGYSDLDIVKDLILKTEIGMGEQEGGLYYFKEPEKKMVCSAKKESASLDTGTTNEVSSYDDDEELRTEEQMDRSRRDSRPEESSRADRLQTVDLMDRSDAHGRPSERQNDGSLRDDQTVDLVDRPDIHGRPFERQNDGSLGDDQTVDRDEEDGRPSPRQKVSDPEQLQTVDPVDRSTDGGRPSPSQPAVENLGRGQREKGPNVRLADYVTHVVGPYVGEKCKYPLSSYVTYEKFS